MVSTLMANPSARARGFTLVEVLIVVAIFALLAGAAIPSFTDSLTRARRAEAKAALMDAANWLERVADDSGVYNQRVNGLNRVTVDTAMLTTAGYGQSPRSGTKRYTITIDTISATAYTLKATPVSTDSQCGTLSLDQDGVRGATVGATPLSGTLLEYCWTR